MSQAGGVNQEEADSGVDTEEQRRSWRSDVVKNKRNSQQGLESLLVFYVLFMTDDLGLNQPKTLT